MTDTASAAPSEREQFERHVEAYTGRDMAYHERNGTTGLEFGWACWKAARAQPTPPAVVEPMTDEQITEIWAAKVRYHAAPIGSTDLEFARDIERAHGIKKGAQDGTL